MFCTAVLPRLMKGIPLEHDRLRLRRLVIIVCLMGCIFQIYSIAPALGQSPPDAASIKTVRAFPSTAKTGDDTPGLLIKKGKVIRSEVNLALVSVNVVDLYDRMVVGLSQGDFRVYEDGVEQEIITFSSEDVPLSLGVVLDLSGSMTNKIDKVREAIMEFLKAANIHDEFCLIGFNSEPELMSGFTNDEEYIQRRILHAAPEGRTAFLDAIYLALGYMRNSKYKRRALLIFSDGGDNHSRHSKSEIKELVKEADVQLYAIGFYNPLGYPYKTIEEIHGPSLLEEITEMTGGAVAPGKNLDDLPTIASKIGSELRNQYVLGYTPSNHDYDGGWRKIKVKLHPPRGAPPLHVHAKTGYFAKAQ